MRSSLIGILFVLQAATSFALDTLTVTRVPLNITWNTPVIGASENPDGLTTTIIGQSGYTWIYPHGTLTTIAHPALVSETLEEAVAVQSRFIYASVGSTLIKYGWPGMKELERHNLNTKVSLINVWTQDRIAVLAGDTVWSFLVDEPLSAGTTLSTAPITSIASHDSTLYMATSEGRIYHGRGDTVEVLVETQRKISHIAASSAFIAMNHPDDSNAALYSLKNDQITELPSSSGGRTIAMCNDSTIALYTGISYRRYTVSKADGRFLFESYHLNLKNLWIETSRIFPISKQLFMLGYLWSGNSAIIASGLDHMFSTTFKPSQAITVVDDSTIAMCAYARHPEFTMEGGNQSTYNNIFHFNIHTGGAKRIRPSPTPAWSVVELTHVDSVYFATRNEDWNYFTSRSGPNEEDIEHYDEYLQVLSRGSNAWMIHWNKTRIHSSEMKFSSNGGRNWGSIDIPGFNSSNFFRSACQVGFNDRFYGPTYNWLNLQYFQANDKYLWLTEPVASPENDVIPRYSLPITDQAVLLILDKKSSDILPSRIWTLDYGNRTSKAQPFFVPDVGYARVVSAHVHNSVMMGLWEAIDTKDLGIFITDGDRWGYYNIADHSFAEVSRSALLVPNDTTMVIFDLTTKELIVYHPQLPKLVSVKGDHLLSDQDSRVLRQYSVDGMISWQHGIHDATISVFDMHGRQVCINLPTDSTSEVQLPGRGLFILQVTGGGEVKRMLVSH